MGALFLHLWQEVYHSFTKILSQEKMHSGTSTNRMIKFYLWPNMDALSFFLPCFVLLLTTSLPEILKLEAQRQYKLCLLVILGRQNG